MKMRLDFVTNSSSSCFIICKHNDKRVKINTDIVIGKYGETEFYNGGGMFQLFFDRLNFLAIQTLYNHNEKWKKNINEVFKRNTGHILSWNYIKYLVENEMAYIDHQSVFYESNQYEDGMCEILNDINVLDKFLFGNHSVICMGTDGDYQDEDSIVEYIKDKDYYTKGNFYSGNYINTIKLHCLID